MATPKEVQRRGRWSLILGTIFAFAAFAAVAYADNVQNDVVAGGNDTIAAGGSTVVNYRIAANSGDGQSGCNAVDGTPATVTINAPAGVTANPSSLAFTSCGTNKPVTFSSSTVGSYSISVSVSDSGIGTYNTNPATFTLRVTSPPDNTAPVITPTITGTAGNNDWYTSNVSLSWSVVDGESAISSQTGCGTVNITADQAETTYTCQATSAGGTTSNSVTIKRDATNPTISASAGSYASGTWTNDDVTVHFTCLDALSGLLGCPSDVVVSTNTPAEGEDVSGSASDNAGNLASSNTINVKVDKTDPTISGSRLPLANAAGWNNTDVVVSFTCGDPLSGIASCGPSPVTVSANGAGQSVLGTAVDTAGNSATDTVSAISIDKLAPSVAYTSASPAANDAGWNNTNVTATFTATDTLSGFAPGGALTDTGTTTASAEGSNVTVGSPAFADLAENDVPAGAASASFKIDKTAPSVDCGSAPTAWSASDVLIACTASDPLSQLGSAADASFNLSTSVDAGTETANASTNSRTVSDNAENGTVAGPVSGIKVDRKAPTYSCPTAPSTWSATDISINCSAADGGSGLDPATDNEFALSTSVAGGAETSNASTGTKVLTDGVGNSVTALAITGLKVDKKAPAISCGSADGVWHSDNVSIDCTATDGGSGVTPTTDASFSLSTTVAAGAETSNAQTGTKNIADAVGNSTTGGPISGNKIDRKSPVVTMTCPTNPVLIGSNYSASWSATDGGSGVATGFAAGIVPLNTSTIGTKTAVVPVGASKDNVDNMSAEKTCGYSVVYGFNGFSAPVDRPNTLNVSKAGQAIPLKWRLTDANGVGISTLTSVSVIAASIGCAAGTTDDLLEEYASGSSGLQNLGDGYYQFNWKTPTTYATSCKTIGLNLGEGSTRTELALFSFKK